MPDFISSQKCTPHSTGVNSHLLFSLGYFAKNLSMSMKECVNRFSNLRDLQNVIRDNGDDRQPEKPYSSGKSV